MGWWQEAKNAIKWAFSKPVKPKKSAETDEYEMVRARNKKGQYVGDDESTPDVNEAYTRRKKKK
jgi:hypothetical protein|tara:strand:+ start:804 stop:995 length:192 start_codon:yes stop_codon:yes gene_type:complete